jgi:hypothetical protein
VLNVTDQAIDRRTEIDRNLSYFLRELPDLLKTYRGKFALLRHESIVNYYDTVQDAVNAANALYPDRVYSIQQVTDSATDLGYYSHAVRLG